MDHPTRPQLHPRPQPLPSLNGVQKVDPPRIGQRRPQIADSVRKVNNPRGHTDAHIAQSCAAQRVGRLSGSASRRVRTCNWCVCGSGRAPRSLIGNACWSYVVVGDQGSLDGCADLPVVPYECVQGEEPLDDPGPQAAGRRPPWRSRPSWLFSVQMTASTRWRSQFGNGRGAFSSLRAGRIRVRPRSSPAKKSSVSCPDRPLSVTTMRRAPACSPAGVPASGVPGPARRAVSGSPG